jgi:hypothetical protein
MKKSARLLVMLLAALSTAFAAFAKEVRTLSTGRAGIVVPQDSDAALWIWTDKYVYTPGETLTLRGTLKTNGDTQLYTLLCFLQNNQTGVRTYFPANTTEASDVFGRTVDQGFSMVGLANVDKRFVIGPGGSLSSGVPAPSELGMYTFVFQLRDSTGSRVVKSAYFKFGVVSGFEDLLGNVEADRTLVNTKAYRVMGTVFVKGNAVLTIEPGTFIFGQPGSQPASSLFITQTGKIRAEGTRNRPIIFTSSLPFGQRKPGDWGGLVLLGSAPVNWPTGFGNIEGLPASADTTYGGSDPNHDCGTLRYVRVEYAGAEFQPNNEINAVTFGGCGKGTIVDHVQARYGLDDLFEWFGGTMDAKYLAGAYTRDDFIDTQIGWTGRLQYILGVAGKDVPGNRGFEFDNNEGNFTILPLNKPTIFNTTFVGAGDTLTQGFDEGDAVAGAWLRRGTGGSFNNTILFNWISNGFTIRDDATVAGATAGNLTVDGLMMWDNGKVSGKANTLEGQVSGSGNLALPVLQGPQAKRLLISDPALRRPLELSDPDFRPGQNSPVFRANWILPPDDGFFDQTSTYIGAFGDVDWTEEWTCFHVESDVAP